MFNDRSLGFGERSIIFVISENCDADLFSILDLMRLRLVNHKVRNLIEICHVKKTSKCHLQRFISNNNSFGLDQLLIYETDAVISGGGAVRCLEGNLSKLSKGDIDIFIGCPIRSTSEAEVAQRISATSGTSAYTTKTILPPFVRAMSAHGNGVTEKVYDVIESFINNRVERSGNSYPEGRLLLFERPLESPVDGCRKPFSCYIDVILCDNVRATISTFDIDICRACISLKGHGIGYWFTLPDVNAYVEKKMKVLEWGQNTEKFFKRRPELWHSGIIDKHVRRVYKYHKRGYSIDNPNNLIYIIAYSSIYGHMTQEVKEMFQVLHPSYATKDGEDPLIQAQKCIKETLNDDTEERFVMDMIRNLSCQKDQRNNKAIPRLRRSSKHKK